MNIIETLDEIRTDEYLSEVLHTDSTTSSAYVAADFAHAAVGQVRKYTGAPYIVHPCEVACIVHAYGGTPEMIAAAFLHDVVEDTEIPIDFLLTRFPLEVSHYVTYLTDISKKEDGNRAERKRIDREHVASGPPESQAIKCADMISNTLDIAEHDKDFAVVYLKEKRLLLDVLEGAKEEWPELYALTEEALEFAQKKLEEKEDD